MGSSSSRRSPHAGSDPKRSRPVRRAPLRQVDGEPAVPEPLRSVVRANAGPAERGEGAARQPAASPATALAHAALLAAGFALEGARGSDAALPEPMLSAFARRGVLRARYSLVGDPGGVGSGRSVTGNGQPSATADEGQPAIPKASCELLVSSMGSADLVVVQAPGRPPWTAQLSRQLSLAPETPAQCRELRAAWREAQDRLARPAWLAAQRQLQPCQALPCLQDLDPSSVEVVCSFLAVRGWVKGGGGGGGGLGVCAGSVSTVPCTGRSRASSAAGRGGMAAAWARPAELLPPHLPP